VRVVLSISKTKDEEKLNAFHQEKKPYISEMVSKINDEQRVPRVLHFFKTNKHIDEFAGAVPEFSSLRFTSIVARAERTRALETFRESETSAQHLYSLRMLNEGVDIPCINALVFHENVGDIRTFIQRIGRGLRVHTQASHVTRVIQFVDSEDVDGILAIADLKNELERGIRDRCSEPGTGEDLVLMEIDPSLQGRIDLILERYSSQSEMEQLVNCRCGKCGRQTQKSARNAKVLRTGDSFICGECSSGGQVLAKCSRCNDAAELPFDRYHSYVLMGTFARCHRHLAKRGQAVEAVCADCGKVDRIPYGKYKVYAERNLKYRCKDHRTRLGESKFLKCTQCGTVERVAASNFTTRWKNGSRPFLCRDHRKTFTRKKSHSKEVA
jgi:hypothetical protein